MARGATEGSAAQRLNVTVIADRAIDRIIMDSDRATEHRRGARNYASNFIKDGGQQIVVHRTSSRHFEWFFSVLKKAYLAADKRR